MNKLLILSALCILLIGCAPIQKKPSEPIYTEHAKSKSSPGIMVYGSGSLRLDDYRGRNLYLKFESSPRLTADLREHFKEMGFSVVATDNEADVSIKIMAIFSFQKSHTKSQVVDFGKAAENTKVNVIAKSADWATRVPHTELAPLVQGLQGNLSANMVLGVGIIDSILTLAGVRSWFNKALVGDERGICLGTQEMCKDWKKFDQQMRLAAIVTPKSGIPATVRAEALTKDEKLLPDQLFHDGMGELTARLFTNTADAQDLPQGSMPAVPRAVSNSSASRPAGKPPTGARP